MNDLNLEMGGRTYAAGLAPALMARRAAAGGLGVRGGSDARG